MTASKIPPLKGGTNQVHLGNTTYSIYMKFGVNISIYMINLYTNIYLAHLNIVSFIMFKYKSLENDTKLI